MKLKKLVSIFATASAVYVMYSFLKTLELESERKETHILIPIPNDDDISEEVDVLDILDGKTKEEQEELLNDLSVKLYEDELSPRQQQIMDLAENNARVDTSLLEEEIGGVTVRTLRRDLDQLEELGLIRKIGKTKGSYYVKEN